MARQNWRPATGSLSWPRLLTPIRNAWSEVRPPQLSEAAWSTKPKTRSGDSDSSATQGSVPIARVSGHEPSRDRRSSGVRQANSSDPAHEVTGNDTKFDERFASVIAWWWQQA